jgi:hypothetical protein
LSRKKYKELKFYTICPLPPSNYVPSHCLP